MFFSMQYLKYEELLKHIYHTHFIVNEYIRGILSKWKNSKCVYRSCKPLSSARLYSCTWMQSKCVICFIFSRVKESWQPLIILQQISIKPSYWYKSIGNKVLLWNDAYKFRLRGCMHIKINPNFVFILAVSYSNCTNELYTPESS